MISSSHRDRMRRFQKIRRGLTLSTLRETFKESERILELRERFRRTPKWVKVLQKVYHKYGLKHVLLLLILIAYAFLGATVFYFLEEQKAEDMEAKWKIRIEENRTQTVNQILQALLNTSSLLIFVKSNSRDLHLILEKRLIRYEQQLGIKYSAMKIEWDFWNAMLYAGTICTTIGYGHLYATTPAGRVATMIYAIFGIPLVLSVLRDLGTLLTIGLKYPWMLTKMFLRRTFRFCTKQSMEDIDKLDDRDRDGLAVFDLPIPVAIGVMLSWIFICSATFCIWETKWDYFTAFYFFFISLSTIGLGDITPEKPKYLLMMFGYIIVGLSLVSMCINLIQAKMERAYEKGKEIANLESQEGSQDPGLSHTTAKPLFEVGRGLVTLGILQGGSSSLSLCSKSPVPTLQILDRDSKTMNIVSTATQTLLSFPLNRRKTASMLIPRRPAAVVPSSLSLDDVMKLVETEPREFLLIPNGCSSPPNEQQQQRSDCQKWSHSHSMGVSPSSAHRKQVIPLCHRIPSSHPNWQSFEVSLADRRFVSIDEDSEPTTASESSSLKHLHFEKPPPSLSESEIGQTGSLSSCASASASLTAKRMVTHHAAVSAIQRGNCQDSDAGNIDEDGGRRMQQHIVNAEIVMTLSGIQNGYTGGYKNGSGYKDKSSERSSYVQLDRQGCSLDMERYPKPASEFQKTVSAEGYGHRSASLSESLANVDNAEMVSVSRQNSSNSRKTSYCSSGSLEISEDQRGSTSATSSLTETSRLLE